ncbi:MAG: hypothetical protein LRY38_06950 [Aeromonadaceae bacterium]|nr:hypothetical protein [Aeromonadaceae bacterium]
MTRSQQGIALITALIITLLIGIIAMAVGKSAIRSQQTASSQYDQARSQAIAQSAMLRAEALFRSTVASDIDLIFAGASGSISTSLESNAAWWREDSNWDSNSSTTSFSGLTEGSPKFRIEEREFVPISADVEEQQGRQYFRVTSRGEGPGGSHTLLQSYFVVTTTRKTSS